MINMASGMDRSRVHRRNMATWQPYVMVYSVDHYIGHLCYGQSGNLSEQSIL